MNQTILNKIGITALNSMQLAAREAIVQHKHVLLLSPTGSGKTLAFLLPLLENLNPQSKQVQVLILTPSRELAIQIEQVWKKMSTGYKIICAYGGHDMQEEINSLVEPPAIMVGTPGRIADHLKRRTFDAKSIHIFVFDEFDKSLALGFEADMEYITRVLKPSVQKLFVSATASIAIPAFVEPAEKEVLNFLQHNESSVALDYYLVRSAEKDKVETLYQLLCNLDNKQAFIFCNHREAVERTGTLLAEKGIPNTIFHGGMEQMQREQALIKFRNGTAKYLIATDLAARGLDIPDIEHIIHYHLPVTMPEFTHRNGRTARMHASGHIYLILHDEEQLPKYLDADPIEMNLLANAPKPSASNWATVYINGGKKEKLNKVDIVGLFMQKGKLTKEELGLIVVKDHNSFVAVKKNKLASLLKLVQPEKIKGKKFLILEAK
ncbi:MAG: DEAD/DEAH box helicase [Sphingobacteriia bacterium]|nr:MAG: DEAD/DEAH box helicase [Sphingobacteriia bacterium]